MFSVGKRIGLGYLLMSVLLVGIGLAGLLAADRISNALNRITGPVNTTVRSVDRGIRGVLLQMIGVDMALTGQPDQAQAQIATGSDLARTSFDAITGTGLVSTDQLDDIRQKMLDVAEDISHSLVRINSDGEKIVADNDKLSDAAHSLSGLSKQLETLVSQFRT